VRSATTIVEARSAATRAREQADHEQHAPVVLEPGDEGGVERRERDVLGGEELDGVVEVGQLAAAGEEEGVPQRDAGQEGSEEGEGRR
jgi:hypothetical protein